MFTGIIEELGKVSSLETHEKGARIRIAAEIVTSDSKDGGIGLVAVGQRGA